MQAGMPAGLPAERAPATLAAERNAGLIAPWWHTVLMVSLIIGISVNGFVRVRALDSHPLHLVPNYLVSIAYEWILAALALWGIRMRGVPLRRLLGERRPGWRAWMVDLGSALAFWITAMMLLGMMAQALLRWSGKAIDPRKIGDVTQKLAPVTGLEMALFLVLCISAGICEEVVFRGYLQQQFARMGAHVWVGVVLAALVFGGAHGYEGVAGVLMIAFYGAMFGVLALLRRGLRTGMIAHVWHDSVSGLVLVLVHRYGLHFVGR